MLSAVTSTVLCSVSTNGQAVVAGDLHVHRGALEPDPHVEGVEELRSQEVPYVMPQSSRVPRALV